ncbi:MAG TPA: phenylalanine--tRNA ligase subunit beta [Solirubrobacteraceae bacterium]|jgi:phenylalanyl-tRNA synthetase beta chain|nr:phenylalanine--tRNA ligase subunit beta [Solirubrobacteraceae bacterium]
MKVPLDWLRKYCDPALDVHGIEERLTMTGTKVEAIHHHGVGAPERFVVGKVLSCERHPDADRLSVCEVDLGPARPARPAAPDGPARIVCGAPNVAAGQTVAVACPGAVMPDGMQIERVKLRGVVSEGMICAEHELAIDSGASAGGILVLDDVLGDGPPAPGTPLAEVLPIATEVVELEVTPNRPDCLGVYGVARELHAATGAPLAPEPWREDPGSEGPQPAASTPPSVEVEVRCPDLCPRFTARVFENVTVAPSPPWLKARLSAAGQRPINNVVDITNYVMLLSSQPLHAFDLDRVAGGRLVVRRAGEGEQVQTLDGQTRTLDGEMVVIEDGEGPTSIAGLMGGARSEVGEGTTRVLMEVATWDGPNIHRASWALGLRSDASARFEKGLPPEQCMYAQALAARLMIELCGATLVPGTIDVGEWEEKIGSSSLAIHLREDRLRGILGVPVPRARQREILQALDFHVEDAPDGLLVTAPPVRRADITREADLIEEVARIDGLERLPATLPRHRPAGRLSPEQRLRRRAVDALVGRGLYETVGWTFTSPESLVALRLGAEDPRRTGAVALENPLSEEQALLRTTLLGSLLDSAARNAARGNHDVRIFEVGTVFSRSGVAESLGGEGARGGSREDVLRDTGVAEHRALGVLLSGRVAPPTWRAPEPQRTDLHAVKGVLEALAAALRVPVECRPAQAHHPFLHPGRAAEVFVEGEPLGWLGELHPLVSAWDIQGAAVMELDLDRVLAAAAREADTRAYSDLVSFPALRQDLAVILPEEVSAAQTLALVRDAAGDLLDEVSVFDVYAGPQVGEGRRSLALALAFRAPDRTLADEDVAPVRERIVAALRERLGGELRG